jgi:hypothetical protein
MAVNINGTGSITGLSSISSPGISGVPVGSASAPAFSFTGDTNTGIYSPGADQVAVATNGTGRLFVDSAGNVGIGTTSPTYLCNVIAAAGSQNIFQAGQTGVSNGYTITSNGTNLTHAWFNGGSEAARIDSSGRLGIGTSSPGAAIHVTSSNAGGYGGVIYNTSSTGEGLIIRAGSTSSHNILVAQTYDGSASRFIVNAAGNVGINTTSPAWPLDVNGIAKVKQAVLFEAANSTNRWDLYTNTDDTFRFNYNGSGNDEITITSGGNVGIGTTSPNSKLAVSNGGAESFEFYPADASNVNKINYYNRGGAVYCDAVQNAASHQFAIQGTERARIDSSGRLLVGTSSAVGTYGFQIEQASGSPPFAGSILLRRGLTTAEINATGYTLGAISAGSQTDIGGSILFESDAAWGSGDYPTRLVFSTTADGASSPTERMRITSDYAQFAPNSANEVKLYLGGSGAQMQYDSANGHIKFITNSGVRNLFLYNGQGTEFRSQSAIFPTTDNAVTCGTGGNRWSAVYAANGTIQTSDSRQKCEIQQSILGTDFIKSLKPVSYRWIEGGKSPIVKDVDENGNIYVTDENGDWVYESKIGQRTHWGFIAQEVKEAVDAAGVDFGGWVLTDKDDPDSQQALRYDQFIAPLTKALQEAMERIETLEGMVAVNNITIDEQQHQLSTLAARLTALESA